MKGQMVIFKPSQKPDICELTAEPALVIKSAWGWVATKSAFFAHLVPRSIAAIVRNMKKHKLLGALIRRERRDRDLAQQEIADKLRQHRSWLVRIERGQRRVDVLEFLEIAHAIGFDPCKLLRKVDHNNALTPLR